MASANHGSTGVAFTATGMLGSIPVLIPAVCNGNVDVPATPCFNFNFIAPAASPGSLHLQDNPESSTAHHPARSTRRRGNVSTSTPSGSGNQVSDNTNITNIAMQVQDDNYLANTPRYPWSTNEVATAELSRRGITHVEGEACKMMVYNIEAKFQEVVMYFRQNCLNMNDRASARWMNPTIPDCDNCCQKNSMRPVIPPIEKEHINWLLLLLGETLGLCTLDQLKHFCAHTKRHRTGAKDRVLYSTYLELCEQLFPGIIMPIERKMGHAQLKM
uniref:DUF7086 domain-containing protein n=1 Tax=Oryza brachyantha TaxID=4533 RepID=J3M9E9_ORYBR